MECSLRKYAINTFTTQLGPSRTRRRKKKNVLDLFSAKSDPAKNCFGYETTVGPFFFALRLTNLSGVIFPKVRLANSAAVLPK